MKKSIFMDIYDEKIPGSIFFKDELWFGLIDINPISIGHCLLIPTLQVTSFDELPAYYLIEYGQYQSRILTALKQAFKCDGISILSCNERAAGQEVPHTHTHYIPRWLGDKPLEFKKTYKYPLCLDNRNWNIDEVADLLRENW